MAKSKAGRAARAARNSNLNAQRRENGLVVERAVYRDPADRDQPWHEILQPKHRYRQREESTLVSYTNPEIVKEAKLTPKQILAKVRGLPVNYYEDKEATT